MLTTFGVKSAPRGVATASRAVGRKSDDAAYVMGEATALYISTWTNANSMAEGDDRREFVVRAMTMLGDMQAGLDKEDAAQVQVYMDSLAEMIWRGLKSVGPRERKDLLSALALLAGGAVVTEWLTDRNDGRGGWIMRAIEWLIDERVRLERQLEPIDRRMEELEEAGATDSDEYRALAGQGAVLSARLEDLDKIENDIGSNPDA